MNTREELVAFKPAKEFFIGIDSDGTAFDSMNIKHLKSFIPAALNIWDLGVYSEDFKKIMEHINLYSEHRGINRFTGLLMAFEKLDAQSGLTTDIIPLTDFVEHSAALSNDALKVWMSEKPHPFLDTVYRWSLEADRLFEEHTQGLLPFINVEPTLKAISLKADIMVISSASGKGLDKDWCYGGLAKYVSLIAGQELGNKKIQLALGSHDKYPVEKVLMIGDAPGDLEAACAVGASFYPIIPGKEEESWLHLREEVLPPFFAGTYKGAYEDRIIERFFESLKGK